MSNEWDEEDERNSKGFEVLTKYLGALVEVRTADGRVLQGRLMDFDPEFLNVLLKDVVTSDGKRAPIALISGAAISYILFIGPPESEEGLEEKVMKLLMKDPNLDPETIARLCNVKIDRINEIIARLRRRGLVSGRSQDGRQT
ncbi:MAG: hypothetical protein J7J99_08735 [Thermoprotei archaeon]|nr:hypothetical protein [Thermoprotei archaeon]